MHNASDIHFEAIILWLIPMFTKTFNAKFRNVQKYVLSHFLRALNETVLAVQKKLRERVYSQMLWSVALFYVCNGG